VSAAGYLEATNMENEGAINKLGGFLGIKKFGQGLATAGRVLSGATGRDIATQNQNTALVNKLVYAAKQEKDPVKRSKLLQMAQGTSVNSSSAMDIDSGLNLSNREVLGSAANIGLNILTPGALKGGKAAVLGKNALLGSAFGAASGLEKGRSAGGVVGSAVGGALIGTALGGASLALRAFKDFSTKTTPKWLMDKAIKPALDETRKSIKFGQKTLGQELLEEGVKGSPEKLLTIAEQKLTSLEDELQAVLNSPSLAEATISRKSIRPYLTELIATKKGVPGLKGDAQRIRRIVDDIPEKMSLNQANVMKRRIYNELRDVSYKLDANLSTKGAALKQIAKALKTEIEKGVGGNVVADINKKLSIYGRLEDRIVDQMARSMRNNSFGLTDAILTSGGLATLNPLGVLAGLAASGVKHAAGSTGFRTAAAQGLNKLQNAGSGKLGQTVSGAVQRAGLNLP
jgi:hypothetical protein